MTSSSRGGLGSVSDMPQHRSLRLREAQQNQIEQQLSEQDYHRISFWEIQFDDDVSEINRKIQVFQVEEKAKLANVLKDFLTKKQEYVSCFLTRVGLEVAPDYRSIIPSEMYFDLIKDRIENGYYRSQEVSEVHKSVTFNWLFLFSNCCQTLI